MNPDITSQSFQGVLVGSILQSITPRFALGLETAWQRQAIPGSPPNTPLPSESTTSLLARLCGHDKSWIAAATLNPGQGVLLATFWKRLGEKVEAGVGLDVKASSGGMAGPTGGGLMVGGPVGGGKVREGTATFGLKYQFRAATLRAQIDSGGRVTAWLERMLSPQINVTFCGDIDHFKVPHPPPIPHPLHFLLLGFAHLLAPALGLLLWLELTCRGRELLKLDWELRLKRPICPKTKPHLHHTSNPSNALHCHRLPIHPNDN